jgi:hypothetical protein
MNGGNLKKDNSTTYIIIAVVVVVLLLLGGVAWWWWRNGKDVSVSISPTSAELITESKKSFIATVTEKNNKQINPNVTWSTSNESLGTIDANGEFTAYDTPGSVTITATSIEDPKQFASAMLTISKPKVPVKNFLTVDEYMKPNTPFYSSNGEYYAITKPGGQLCIRDKNNNDKWCREGNKDSDPNASYYTLMQSDGNLCTYKGTERTNPLPSSLWCNKATSDIKENYVIMGDDGKLCTYKGTGPSDNRGKLWCRPDL